MYCFWTFSLKRIKHDRKELFYKKVKRDFFQICFECIQKKLRTCLPVYSILPMFHQISLPLLKGAPNNPILKTMILKQSPLTEAKFNFLVLKYLSTSEHCNRYRSIPFFCIINLFCCYTSCQKLPGIIKKNAQFSFIH